MVGESLNHYRITGALGRGGMGEVYVADDTKLNRKVAVKLLPPELAADAERRQRFVREAQAIAALNHPGIVTVHSVEESGGRLFLTMELVEGTSLADQLAKGPLALDRFLAIAIPLSDALSAAHQKGILHRDLKPSNIMLGADGRVKMLDFGLAKLLEAPAAGGALTEIPTQALTGEGRILGTVAYMSPEQAEGKPIDARSDIFSLGIILYEMATGERPFKGNTGISLISSILKDTPRSVTDLRADLPRHLGRIIKRALTKDPEHRYQTAKDLRNDLQELKTEIDSGELTTRPATTAEDGRRGAAGPTRRPLVAIVSGTVAVAVIVTGLYLRFGRSGGAPAATPAATSGSATPAMAIRMSRLTSTGKANRAAISPDGRYVVHVVDEGGLQSLWVRQVATTSNVQIVPPSDVRYVGLTFTPDGNFIDYVSYPKNEIGATLWQIPVLGGAPSKVVYDIDSAVAFSPDGSRIAFARGRPREGASDLIVAGQDGSSEKRLATRPAPAAFSAGGPAWSPDGKTIAIGAQESAGAVRGVVLQVRVDDGTVQEIGSRTWLFVESVAWAPDGRELLLTAFDPNESDGLQIWGMSFPDGVVRRITNDLNTYTGVSFAPGSNLLATVQIDLRAGLWIVPVGDTGRARAITAASSSADGIQGMAWTPDGRIVYTTLQSGRIALFVTGLDGQDARVIVSEKGSLAPAVSPDGRSVAFYSNRGGRAQIWSVEIDGGSPRALTPGPRDAGPVFDPDGRSIFYTAREGGRPWIMRVSAAGGEPAAATLAGDGGDKLESMPQRLYDVSPDGRWLAGPVQVLGAQALVRAAIVPLAGNGSSKRFNFVPNDVKFTTDSRGLSYIDTKGGVSNIWVQPIDGGTPRQVTSFTTGRIYTHAWSRDGMSLALCRGNVTNDVVLISNPGR